MRYIFKNVHISECPLWAWAELQYFLKQAWLQLPSSGNVPPLHKLSAFNSGENYLVVVQLQTEEDSSSLISTENK